MARHQVMHKILDAVSVECLIQGKETAEMADG